MRQSLSTQPAPFASPGLKDHPALKAPDGIEGLLDWSRPEALSPQGEEGLRIHTNGTNTVQKVHSISLDDQTNAANRGLLRACFLDPENPKPLKTRLRGRGPAPARPGP
jgi:hypothetical protein